MKERILLEKYKVTGEVLGSGSFGVVMSAISIRSDAKVAVKFSNSKELVEHEYDCLHLIATKNPNSTLSPKPLGQGTARYNHNG